MRAALASKILAIAFAICMLSLIPASVLADGNGQGGSNGNQNGNDGGQDNGNRDHDKDKQWKDESNFMNGGGNGHQNMVNEAASKRFFGRFNLTDGVVDGRFIAFTFDESSGNVSDYALKNGSGEVTVFDSIQILGFEPTNISLHGSVMLLRNDSVQVIIHDNPTGMFHVVSNQTNVTISFLLAEGMSAMPLSPDVEEEVEVKEAEIDDMELDDMSAVIIFGQGFKGIIATDNGNISLDDAEAGLFINVTISEDHVMFRAHPVFSNHRFNEQALLQAISEGRVAGEMSLMLMDGEASYDTMEYRNQFRMQLISAERDRIRLQVEDQEHAGRVVVLKVDQGTFDSSKGELRVELDGMKVSSSTNPLDVLYAEGSSPSDAIYCVVESEGTSMILVYVPSFSVHELAFTSLGPMDALLSAMGLVALLGAIAIVGVAAYALLKRKR